MALRLGDIFVERGIIKPQELQIAVNEQQRTKKMLGQVLVDMGMVTERKLLDVLAEQQGVAYVELKDINIDEKVIRSVPAKFVWHYKVMPISIEDNVLTIAISNPFDLWPVDDLEAHLGFRVEKVLATSGDILEAIRKYYGVGADTIEKILSVNSETKGSKFAEMTDKIEDLEKMSESASIIKLVNQILKQAINDRATDIHMEVFREDLTLRYRIDGILYDTQVSDDIKYLYPAIISRIKVMSGLDIVEKRLPQDGRAKVKIGNTEYELRTSVIPTLSGENVVIRILPTTMLFDIANLGILKKDLETLERLIKTPNGIIFVTGPTGSGKTTTLYACLSRLNTRQRKILTIEDPIEYELKGISQTQINPKIGLSFAKILRSMLRHDPDVMMVGEVRDFETAEVTIQTALTGHLVFSTIHTNDAASGITRLIDIGIEPYLIASSVQAFIAQRLVRVICPKCKTEDTQQMVEMKDKIEADLKDMFKKLPSKIRVFKGNGCKACNNTGYAGRIGIYEILLVGAEIKKLILQKVSSDMIKDKAVELGMRTLRQDGWEKVLEGITTPEEVIRVTQ